MRSFSQKVTFIFFLLLTVSLGNVFGESETHEYEGSAIACTHIVSVPCSGCTRDFHSSGCKSGSHFSSCPTNCTSEHRYCPGNHPDICPYGGSHDSDPNHDSGCSGYHTETETTEFPDSGTVGVDPDQVETEAGETAGTSQENANIVDSALNTDTEQVTNTQDIIDAITRSKLRENLTEGLVENDGDDNKTLEVGDPVKISIGEFVTAETDFVFNIGELEIDITRKYGSHNNPTEGLLGNLWESSLDDRIIHGAMVDSGSVLQTYKDKILAAELKYGEMIEKYNATITDIQESILNLNEKIADCEKAIAAFTVAKNKAVHTKSKFQAKINTYTDLKAAIVLLRDDLVDKIEYFEISVKPSTIETARDFIDIDLENQLSSMQNIHNAAESFRSLNSKVSDSGNYHETGNGTVTLIDEDGMPVVFRLNEIIDYSSSTQYGTSGIINYYPAGSGMTPMQPVDYTLYLSDNGEFVKTTKDGSIKIYNFYGLPVLYKDRKGNSVEYTYTQDLAQLENILSDDGRQIDFTYTDGYISKIDLPEEQSVHFSYNAGKLSTITDVDGDVLRYEYESNLLKRIIKPDESFRNYNYTNLNGKSVVSSTVDEEGDTEYFYYHPEDKFTRYIDPSGVEVFHYYDDRKRETKVVYPDYSYTEKTYDDNNNVKTSRSRSGNTTSFSYDDKRNITEINHPDGSFETRKYNEFSQLTELNDADGNQIINDYDDKGNLTSTKVFDDRGSLESEESYIYNGKGLVTSRSRGNTSDGHMITEDFTYDEYGSISTVTDGENNIWVYDYDSIGKLLSVTDPDENTTSYEYTPSGRISKIVYPDETFEQTFYTNRKDIDYVVDRDGNTFDYTYNKKHNLLSVENPLNQSVVYTYNPIGKAESKSVFSENGDLEAYSEYIYDSNTGELITERKQLDESESATTSYDYFNSLLWKITDPEGTVTEYLYNSRDRVETKIIDHVDLDLPVKEYFDYTGRGQLEVYTDPRGYETEYDYTAVGQVSQVLNPDNSIKEYTYDGLGRLISLTDEEDYNTQYRYNDTGKRSTVMYSDGTSEKWTYSDTGFIKTYTDRNETTFEYEVDQFGQILEVNLPYPYEGLSEKYTYNTRGQILTSEDPNGNIWTREYDKLGNLVKTIDPENKETINEYTPLGQLFRTTTADSAKWEREFDMAGRLIGTLDPMNNRTTYGYDKNGQLLFEEDPLSRTKSYEYNPLGRLTSTRDGENVGIDYAYDPSGNLTVETQTGGEPYYYMYDKRNRLEKEINRLGDIKTYTYFKNNKVHRITDFKGDVTIFSYDEADRLSRKEFSVGGFESFTYDGAGNLLLTENNASRLEYAYDPLGRMTKSIDHYKDEEISYEYDPSGNRTALSWADEDRRATWAYDNLNRPISMIDPEGNETNFSYDLMGREIERELSNGISINTTYDIAGRVTSISHNEGNRYRDLPARFYSYNDAGQVTLQMDEKGRTSSWEYDNAGRLSKASYAFAGGKSINDFWERTYLGITEKEIKDGYESYQDSHFSFIENLFRNNGFYDDFGISEDDYREDLDEAYTELSGVFPKLEKSSASAFISPYGNFSYKRNWGHLKKGLPKEVNKWFNSWSLMRFLFQPQWTEEFSYDSKGNITNKSNGWGDVPYTYNDENQMITAGERQYEYDKNGNLSREWLEDRSANYKYDGENRLIELTSNTPGFIGTPGHLMDKGLMYTYDSIGRRTSYQQIEKLEGEDFRDRFDSTGTRMSYLYDGLGFNVLAEGLDSIGQTSFNRWSGNSDRSFNPTSEYLYTNGKAVVRTDVTSEHQSFLNRHGGWQYSKNYYTQDNLGSIIGIMDSHGHVDEKYTYDAFGKLVEGRFDYVNKLGYNGKMYDNYSGLVNYGFRDYSPVAMRFTTVDPIKDGTNWFAYVGNDPINRIDLFGLQESDAQVQKDLLQIKIGYRQSCLIGGEFETGIIINRNNPWDSGILLNVGIGLGVERAISTPLNTIGDMFLSGAARAIDQTHPKSSKEIEGVSTKTVISAGVGGSIDSEGNLAGVEALAAGGGIYVNQKTVISANEVVESIVNFLHAPLIMMNIINPIQIGKD